MEALIFNMVTMCVSRDTLALLLSEDELGDVRAAVRLSLENAGLEPWHDLEAELFDRGDEALLLARPRAPRLICSTSEASASRARDGTWSALVAAKATREGAAPSSILTMRC